MRAVNHSWGKPSEGGGFPLDGSSLLTLGFDWSVRQHNVLHIIAGNEGSMVPIPKDNFNGMTIGRSAKDANGVYRLVSARNTFDEDAAGDRTSIALIALGDDVEVTGLGNTQSVEGGTSLAAPHVTGTVALLQQNATTTNERRPQVMKAVLMNSADKIKDIIGMERTVLKKDGSNWFGSTADTDPNIPLDIEMGTGHLNANRAHTQFTAGEHPSGGVDIGWDYHFQNDPFIPYRYHLNLEKDDYVSATLVWDREVALNSPSPEYEPGDNFIDFGFANFDLYLVPAGLGREQAVASSTSTAQNVEHIFAQVPAAGDYELQVWIGELNQVFYAIAWWAGADMRGSAALGDFNGDGSVNAADYVVWRKTDGGSTGYNNWRTNFGETVGSGGAATVPEPTGIVFAIGLIFGGVCCARFKHLRRAGAGRIRSGVGAAAKHG